MRFHLLLGRDLRRVEFTLIVEMSLHTVLSHLTLLLSDVIVDTDVLGGLCKASLRVRDEQHLVQSDAGERRQYELI